VATEEHAEAQLRRVTWLSAVLAAVGILLVGRLAWWQLIPRPEIDIYRGTGTDRPNVVPAPRGAILDANGYELAASTATFDLAVSPSLLDEQSKQKLARDLARITEKDASEIEARIDEATTDNVYLERELPARYGRELENLGVDALAITVRYKRVYPDDELAASVLGFVDFYWRNVGNYGLEEYYEGLLRGEQGKWYGVRDPWGKQIFLSLGGYRPARDGADLTLTLDRVVQHRAEQILREGIEANKATSGNILVLDSRTGAVLAMANHPSYSPGAYWRTSGAGDTPGHANPCISHIYEPGSVFKPLTIAAALEARVIPPGYVYDDRGEIQVGQQRIFNSDRKAHGATDLVQLLAYSRNVGAAHIAALLGETRFYESLRRFGFGETTGIDLAHEEKGIMRVPGDRYWHKSDLATNSFGQGLAVTPLQVAAAFTALANDGLLMRPYLVSSIHYHDRSDAGASRPSEPTVVRRVLRSEVAEYMQQIMAQSLELGMRPAMVPGYRMAGKSGTASIADQEGYQTWEVVASYVGFGPLPDPRFVVLVKFDKPKEGYWGVEVAAPEFRRMVEFLFDYYGVAPER